MEQTVTLTVDVKGLRPQYVNEFFEQLIEHIFDTYNDDESIRSISWQTAGERVRKMIAAE